ncbi:MAG: hypothetical protein WD404_07570 [Solirubrobacterales bacterium]
MKITGKSRAAASVVLAAALALAVATAAYATKGGDSFIGQAGAPPTGTDADGGFFNTPRDVAADHDTGQVYVADSQNHRIQRFDAEGNFELAFGRDAVEAGGSGDVPSPNEVQRLTVDATAGAFKLLAPNFLGDGVAHNEHQTVSVDATGGTFVLQFRPPSGGSANTESIPFDASALAVQEALEALDPVDPGDIAVSGPDGGPWDVEFEGALASTDLPAMRLFGSLTGGSGGGSGDGSIADGQYTAAIPHDAPAVALEAALEALDAVGAGNVSVSGAGPWDIEFVAAHAAADIKQLEADPAALIGGSQTAFVVTITEGENAMEVCVVATECRAARPGVNGGMFEDPRGLAVDPDSGDLYVADTGNGRLQHFSFDDGGTPADPSDDVPVFEGAWGSNTIPDGGAGNLPGPNEVQRFRVTISDPFAQGPPGGDFTLSFDGQTTAPIAWEPDATAIEAALEGLPNVAPGDVSVSEPVTIPDGGTQYIVQWEIEFSGAYQDANVPQASLDISGIVFPHGEVFRSSSTPIQGDSNYEVCTVAAECQAGLPGQTAGAFDSSLDGATNVSPYPLFQFGSLDVSKDGAAGAGKVFAADPGNRRVMEFDLDGAFARAFGYGVDSGASQFEICTAASECRRGNTLSANLPNGAFSKDNPSHVAIDGGGVLYASSGSGAGGVVMRFDTTVEGDDETVAAAMLLPDPYLSSGSPTAAKPLLSGGSGSGGLEVDPVGGNLLHLIGGSSDTIVQELDTAANPPLEVDRHMEGSGSSQTVNGLGLLHGAGADKLFVSSDSGTIDDRVLVLDDDGAGPLELTISAPTDVGPFAATFHGTVDVNGPTPFAASHRFQYSGDGGTTWTDLPASDGPFDDSDPHPVSDTVSGLDPNTSYLVRLTASRAFNGGFAETTAALAFDTPPATPTVQTLATSLRTDVAATLTGRLNPNGSETEWRFEWGTDESYGNATPVEQATGATARPVLAEIDGLEPDTTYHYRLIADNGEEVEPGDTVVEGEDASFTTRATPPAETGRAYEMVTPPFKLNRTTGSTGRSRGNANTGVPTPDGEAIVWRTSYFPLSQDVGGSFNGDHRRSERTAAGWVHQTLNTKGVAAEDGLSPNFTGLTLKAGSADLRTFTANNFGGTGGGGALFPGEGPQPSKMYTFRAGTGDRGWSDWLPDTTGQPLPENFTASGDHDAALINGDGSAMLRWGDYRGLGEDPATPGDDDPSDEQLLPGAAGGDNAYLMRVADPDDLPTAFREPVNQCTGTIAAGDATEVPDRASADPSAEIGARSCEEGSVVSVRGAGLTFVVGTALSEDGSRAFFLAPDPSATGVPDTCSADTGAETSCPPQLYVRQHGPGGEEFVRWISRSRSVPVGDGSYEGAPIASQPIGELKGAFFLRASSDGRYVYFATAGRLTPDDPSDASRDVYRYELPADLSADPGEGSLLRVTGGADGTAEPEAATVSGGIGTTDASLRYLSQDGRRAYFITEGPIDGAGADADAPAGGTTVPGGPPPANTIGAQTRHLYLFDANRGGADRWRFVAQIPFGASGTPNADALSACSVQQLQPQADKRSASSVYAGGERVGSSPTVTPFNCFRSTPDGSHVVFLSAARLTSDDVDDAGDVFLYDAAEDELVRVSAPRGPAAAPYPCHKDGSVSQTSVFAHCNAHLWETEISGNSPPGEWDYLRGSQGMWQMNLAANPDGTVSVFFNSRSRLLPEDTNGDFTDVYQWRQGRLSLVSPGDSELDAWFSGNSSDGEDVFFQTGQRLDPRELEDFDLDIYDARRGGGIPYTPPPTPCDVLALECESEAIAPPPTREPRTLAGGRSENLPPGSGGRCAKLGRSAKKAARRSERLRAAARRTANPRARRRLAARARNSARTARRAAKGAKRCRHRARAKRRASR